MISVSAFQELVTSGSPDEGGFRFRNTYLTWHELLTLSLAMET